MRPSKTPSCQLVIPSFSSGNFSSAWFYLTSKTEVLLFQSIGVFFFCSYWIQYTAIFVSYFILVFYMHLS